MSEELGERAFGESATRVVLDPIDGSLNAKRGIPYFSLSLAVADGPLMGDVHFGFVHDFGTGEEWTAIRGEGACSAACRSWAPAPTRRSRSSSSEATRTALVAEVRRRAERCCARLRLMGSLALSLCQLAAGRVDAVCSLKPARSVDIAAAQLLVRERGLAVGAGRRRHVRGGAARPRRSLADRRRRFARVGRACRRRAGRVTQVRIGCSGWNYDHWRHGVFYPERLPARRWLEYYARHFDTVEVNATFYRLPARAAVAGWVERAPPGFVFAVKMSRYVTHVKRLRDLRPSVELFYGRIAPLVALAEARAGALAAAAHIPPRRRAAGRRRSPQLPPGRHCFEFRHESWFVDEVYELLRRHGVALVIGDTPERPFQTHELTADWTFVRFHYGHRGRGGNYSERELAEWARADRRLARARRRLRVLQQRLAGVRAAQRAAAAAAARASRRFSSTT